MKRVCIIPARSGSKRIKNKNISNFLGRPIIKYPLQTAINSGLFERIIVSTDSCEIASTIDTEIHHRSKKNASDLSSLTDVLKEVIKDKKLNSFDYICLMLPTSVFVKIDDLKNSFRRSCNVVSVCEYKHPIQRALTLDKKVSFIRQENQNKRTQDMVRCCHDAGQFYWINVNKFLKENKIFNNSTLPYVYNYNRVTDIDSKSDWELAEILYSRYNKFD